ncbi:hypothetical protein ACPPVO_01860 [Dactylosporangium sp. McL0621]|uniref:hypothetical protein n=1 Tax=Dactylosporangium sp. McL0621 TaxID=3415678 RepID=UPI003CE8B14A
METNDGIELLLDVGLDRRIVDSTAVDITSDGGQWSRRRAMLLRHSPSPHEIDRALATLRAQEDRLLFVVARAGRALQQAARAGSSRRPRGGR